MSEKTTRRKVLRYGSILGGAALAGCTDDADESNGNGNGNGTNGDAAYQVGVSIPDMQFQFFTRQELEWNRIQEERDDIDGAFYDGQGAQETQISDIETAIASGVDFLVVSPITEEGTVPAVERANDEGIPVINMDRTIVGAETEIHIASDNPEMGYDATMLTLELMQEVEEKGQYNIIELQGVPGTSVANDRRDGFVEAVEDHDEIVELESQVADFSTSEALNVMEDLVTSHGDDIDGVYAHNDLMAIGAQQVLQANDYDDVPIVGIDGDDTWVETLTDEPLYGTIAQLPEEMLRNSIEFGIDAVEGEDLPDFVQQEHLRITQENAQDYYDQWLADL